MAHRALGSKTTVGATCASLGAPTERAISVHLEHFLRARLSDGGDARHEGADSGRRESLRRQSDEAELVSLGVGHDEAHALGVCTHLAQLAATKAFDKSDGGLEIVNPQIEVDPRLAYLALGDRLEVDDGAARYERADAEPGIGL